MGSGGSAPPTPFRRRFGRQERTTHVEFDEEWNRRTADAKMDGWTVRPSPLRRNAAVVGGETDRRSNRLRCSQTVHARRVLHIRRRDLPSWTHRLLRGRSEPRHAPHQKHRNPSAADQLSHGYGHRSRHGHRDGAAWRMRLHPL